MVDLARRACAVEGGLPLEVGKKLVEDGFLRLRLAATARRTTPGAPALDIGAIFSAVLVRDLGDALRTDLITRTTRE
eukprot:5723050-Pleurochrysis_carterae.AAC.1